MSAGVRAFESLTGVFSALLENLRAPAKQKFDGMPRWVGGRMRIACNVEHVYAFWRFPSNLLKVLRIVKSLNTHEGGVTSWELRGQLGQSLAYSCDPVIELDGERIEWRASADAPVQSRLALSFLALDENACELGFEWTLTLKPHQAATIPLNLDGLMDEFTQRMLDDDLDRLRVVLESQAHAAVVAQDDTVASNLDEEEEKADA